MERESNSFRGLFGSNARRGLDEDCRTRYWCRYLRSIQYRYIFLPNGVGLCMKRNDFDFLLRLYLGLRVVG